MDHGLTRDQTDALEQYLATELQLPAETRVEVAGFAVAKLARDRLPDHASTVVVLAGPGWIGATALVAARRLLAWGARPIVLLGVPRERFTTIAAAEADRFELQNGRMFEPGAPLAAAALWIDGLFGTHFAEPLSDELKDIIDAVNHDPQPTIAIDLPSGLDATTGKASLPAIRADVTLALGYPTAGVLKPFATQLVGQLLVADVGIPAYVWRKFGITDAPVFEGEPYVQWERKA